MIPKYRVTALRIGSETVDKSTLTLGLDFGEQIEIPYWASAIEGNGHRIMVDSGIVDPEWVDKNVAPCKQSPDERLDVAVRHLGWDIESVEAVIHTHLHYDHCGGNVLFANARFYVSPWEWEYANNPIATQRGFYDGAWKRGDLRYFSYHFTEDHFEVLPGIRIIMTPGHTLGHQSVLVNTDEGVVSITGDAVSVLENLDEASPPGILHDTALRSIRRIKEYADRVVPGHDPNIESYQDHLFPRTK